MTIKEIDKDDCSGCCACMSVCKSNAITMNQDKEGFYVPKIQENICTKCGQCFRICPSRTAIVNKETQVGYIVKNRNKKKLKKSASGGAFLGIATYLIEKYHAIVVGAAVCDDLKVRHILVDNIKDLEKIQNSKYVQSYIGDIYIQILQKLEEGRKVLFSGTPCQIAGLYASIPEKKRINLYTADLVCHGVPSPVLLKRQMTEDSKSKKGKVLNFWFRYKKTRLKKNSSYFLMVMAMQYGIPIIRRPSQDVYYKLFLDGMDFRESCYKCKYANLNRMGDFTLGDCDSRTFYQDFYPEESNSILLLNSSKSKIMWNELSSLFYYKELDIKREAQCNHQLSHPVTRPMERDNIYEELLSCNWTDLESKYVLPQKKLDRYKLFLLLNIPEIFIQIFAKIKEIRKKSI